MLLHKDVVASLIHNFQITFKTKKKQNIKTKKQTKTIKHKLQIPVLIRLIRK